MGLSNSAMSLGRIAELQRGGFVFDPNLIYPLWSGATYLLTGFLVTLFRASTERAPKGETSRFNT